MANTLIIIGAIGIKKAYLNITKDDAIERFCNDLEIPMDEYEEYWSSSYKEITFYDEFEVYDAWEK